MNDSFIIPRNEVREDAGEGRLGYNHSKLRTSHDSGNPRAFEDLTQSHHNCPLAPNQTEDL